MTKLKIREKSRLVSLDFFRGFAIVSMMLINFVGYDTYSQLKHAAWNGWTFADMVFPFFLWIIGVAMVFSFTRRIQEGNSKKQLLLHILKRSVILFALGLLINLFPYFDFSTVRIMGVLQRIAITYLFAGIILLYLRPKWQVISTVFLLIVYWLLIVFVPVPGFGPGVLEKGGNLVQYIDSLVLGGHMYEQSWDPEGILSTIPAISTILFGVLAGQLLIRKNKKLQNMYLMILLGFGLLILGCIMNIWLPINKNLWTSSFSVFMAGLASMIFAISYWIIDMKGFNKWSLPFVICGTNAISLYVFSSIVGKLVYAIKIDGITLNSFFYQNLLQMVAPKNASLLLALIYVIIIYVVAYVMYKRKWFLRI